MSKKQRYPVTDERQALERIAVGGTFLVEPKAGERLSTAAHRISGIVGHMRRHGRPKLKVLTAVDGEYIRVWRIA